MYPDGVSVRGMAYDWLEDNIYYTDDAMGHVGVCSVKTQACTVIADEDVDAPYGIALALRSSRLGLFAKTAGEGSVFEKPIRLIYSQIHLLDPNW